MSPSAPPSRRRAAAVATVIALSSALLVWQPPAAVDGAEPVAPTNASGEAPATDLDLVPATQGRLPDLFAPDAGLEAPPSAAPATPQTSPELAALYDQELSWGACPDGSPVAQCATATVPLDYTDPAGTTISVALKRLPALDGRAELGSLLLNPGGPGASGVDTVEALAAGLTAEVRSAYDVVGFDPRGVGASTHLTCWAPEDLPTGTVSEKAGQEPQEPGVPAQADYWELIASGQEVARACREHSEVPELIEHLSSAEVARDLDLLRSALGDEQLSYLGYSYGTVIGALYAELFPDRVGRLVLDGAADSTLTRAQWLEDQYTVREERLQAFVEYWRGQEGSPLSGDTAQAVEQVVGHLQSIAGTTLPYTGLDGTRAVMSGEQVHRIFQAAAVQLEEYWPALAASMTDVMTRGDATRLHRLSELVGTSGIIGRPQTEAEAVASAAFDAVTCSDDPRTGEPEAWAAQDAQALAGHPLLTLRTGTAVATTEAYCHGWGVTSPQAPPVPRGHGAAPILVVGATGDPNTPYEWAQTLSEQLESARLLTVKVNFHTAVGVFPCPTAAASDYLLSGALPEPGAVCANEVALQPYHRQALDALAG